MNNVGPLASQNTQIYFCGVGVNCRGNQIKVPDPWQAQALTRNSYCAYQKKFYVDNPVSYLKTKVMKLIPLRHLDSIFAKCKKLEF
jgi:hypothetical protein